VKSETIAAVILTILAIVFYIVLLLWAINWKRWAEKTFPSEDGGTLVDDTHRNKSKNKGTKSNEH